MQGGYEDVLSKQLGKDEYARLKAVSNTRLHQFVADAIALCRPYTVWVCDDSPESRARTRRRASRTG